MRAELVDSRDLVQSDTILTGDDVMRTIGRGDVTYYKNNPRLICRRVLFAKWFKGKIICY